MPLDGRDEARVLGCDNASVLINRGEWVFVLMIQKSSVHGCPLCAGASARLGVRETQRDGEAQCALVL